METRTKQKHLKLIPRKNSCSIRVKTSQPTLHSGPTPPLKTPLGIGTLASVKGKRPTPPLKTQLLKLTPTKVLLQNTTVTGGQGNRNQGILKLKEETASTSGQKLNELSSPRLSKKSKLEQTANTPKAGPSAKNTTPDSYELTPDPSSFTSYDMSDDDETLGTQKPIENIFIPELEKRSISYYIKCFSSKYCVKF